jgi:purine nucleosidase
MLRLVIDTDPGVDDAHALMLAAAHPQARIEAVTTVAGNVNLERTTANACLLADMLQLEAAIYRGCGTSLLRPMPDASYFHGQDGLGDSDYPPSPRKVQAEHAAQALIRLASESPGELTLVALGPLTNLALATRLDPRLPSKFRRLVCMGGAVRALGNTINPSAEFNFYTDPEAAFIVSQAWPGLELVPWETVAEHALSVEQVEELLALQSPRAEFFRRITARSLAFIEQMLGERSLFLADAIAMAVAVEPGIVRRSKHHNVRVELAGEHTRGQTTVDWYGLTGQEPNVHIVMEVDRERLWQLMRAALA